MEKFLHHPDLRGVRIINKLPEFSFMGDDLYRASNDSGLELIYSLLSRKNFNPLKVDFIFNNWMPPFDSSYQINEKPFDLIKKIQDSADNCSGLKFGEVNLNRTPKIVRCHFIRGDHPISIQAKDYQFKFVKMICNIALTHFAHTIYLEGLRLSAVELGLILDEIRLCDKTSLHHLDLGRNDIDESAAKSLSALLQSESTNLKTLKLNQSYMSDEAFDIIAIALKNNHSLKLIEIKNAHDLKFVHPIRNDERVRLSKYPW
jgi:hypothetical protein